MTNLLHDDAFGKLIIRLSAGALILFHGVAKVLHPDSLGFIRSMLEGVELPAALAYGVYAGEVIAPLMIVLGIYCRLGGLVVVVNMLFAIWLAHADDLFSLTEHGGWALELQAFYLFTALALVFLGSGRYAIKPD
ncbi:MAG: DoxX family protein [Gammaproteobacteria bacterium]|jgi:putative oxidoreductase